PMSPRSVEQPCNRPTTRADGPSKPGETGPTHYSAEAPAQDAPATSTNPRGSTTKTAKCAPPPTSQQSPTRTPGSPSTTRPSDSQAGPLSAAPAPPPPSSPRSLA